MNMRVCGICVLMVTLMGVLTLQATAQETIQDAIKSVAPNNETQDRFQIVPHNFTVNGIEQEIFIKMDRFTGKTWRFHASSPRWTVIAEPTTGRAREGDNRARYELLTHDYFDQNGDEQELCLRADLVSGFTWTYRGASGAWKDVEQDE